MSTAKSNGTVLFAQLDRFSYTNDAMLEHLRPRMAQAGLTLEPVRVYRELIRNPLHVAMGLAAVARSHGPRALFDRKLLNERFIKTPFFFRLASRWLRRYARRFPDLAVVFQTQCLFDARVGTTPLVLYTDNTMRNRINRSAAHVGGSDAMVALEGKVYRGADAIGVSAGHVRQSLVEDYGVSPDRVSVTYIGANGPRPRPAPVERYASRHILFVGIDWERKGGPTLVKAFEIVANRIPDARLTVVGCRPDVSHPRVTILGRVPPEQVATLMAEAAVFCMPSLVEPSSVAALEAARAELPIVATHVGGFLDSVDHGTTGLLVAPGDAEALADALIRLLEDPAECRRMGEAGAKWVARFDWNIVCDRLAELIVDAAGARA